MRAKPLFSLLSATTLLAGCTAITPDTGGSAAASTVSDRLGVPVEFSDGQPDSIEVIERINAMISEPLTLDSAAELALLTNRRVQSSLARAGIAQAAIVRAATAANPRLSAEWLLAEAGGGQVLGLGLAANLVDLISLPSRVRSASQEAAASSLSAAEEVIGLSVVARLAALDAMAAAEMAQLAAEDHEISSVTLAVVEELNLAGNIPETILIKARVREQEDRLAAASDVATADAAIEKLSRALGLGPVDRSSLRLSMLPQTPPIHVIGIERAEELALERSLALAASRLRIQALLSQEDGAAAQTWLLGLETGVEIEHGSDGETELGPTLGIQIPLFGLDDSRSRELAARVTVAAEEHLALVRDLRSLSREYWPRLEAAIARSELASGLAIETSEHSLQEALRQYNAMQIGVLQLLEARRELTSARRREVSARREAWQAWIAVDAIASGAPMGSITAINGLAGEVVDSPKKGPGH